MPGDVIFAMYTSDMFLIGHSMFKRFKVIGIKQVSGDSFVYTFALPGNQALGIGIGQHAILRLAEFCSS